MLFASCEVEFSPNDTWRETPVVYCLLDQDDDTTYVRIQRCFLGEGNQYAYSPIRDSNVYSPTALSVYLQEWNTAADSRGILHRVGDTPRRVFPMSYTEFDNKEEGLFFSQRQPIYYLPSAGLFDTSFIYRLVVVKNATGDTIATAETPLIAGQMFLETPNDIIVFTFSGKAGECQMIWSTIRNARQYRPIVRFHYRDFIVDTTVRPYDTTITPHYVDIPCGTIKSDMRSYKLQTTLLRSVFLAALRNGIHDTVCNKNIIDTVEINIQCCSEALAEYLFSVNPLGTFEREPFSYSNIEGGLGVFAARRRHIVFRVPSSPVGPYVNAIKELGIGF